MIQEIFEFTQQQLQQNALTTVSPYDPNPHFLAIDHVARHSQHMHLLPRPHLRIHITSYIRVRFPQLLYAAGAIPPRHDPGNRKVTRPARRRQDPPSSAAAVLEPAAGCFPPVAHRFCIWGFQSARDRALAAGAIAFPVLVLRRACVLSCTLWSLLFVALISFVVHPTHFIESDFTVSPLQTAFKHFDAKRIRVSCFALTPSDNSKFRRSIESSIAEGDFHDV